MWPRIDNKAYEVVSKFGELELHNFINRGAHCPFLCWTSLVNFYLRASRIKERKFGCVCVGHFSIYGKKLLNLSSLSPPSSLSPVSLCPLSFLFPPSPFYLSSLSPLLSLSLISLSPFSLSFLSLLSLSPLSHPRNITPHLADQDWSYSVLFYKQRV